MDPEALPTINWLVGRNVAAMRKWMDWSQTELGRQIGMNQEAISRAERGKRPFTLEELLGIAAVMGRHLMGFADARWPSGDKSVTIKGVAYEATEVLQLIVGDWIEIEPGQFT